MTAGAIAIEELDADPRTVRAAVADLASVLADCVAGGETILLAAFHGEEVVAPFRCCSFRSRTNCTARTSPRCWSIAAHGGAA